MTKIAFIGTGGVAERHAEALSDIKDAELVGVWSRNIETRNRFASRFGAKAYEAEQALFDDLAVDAVFVLSNAESHVDYAIKALAANKHVLVEKPVGLSVSEITLLLEAAINSDRVVMPSHNYIYAPAVRRMQHHLNQGKLGRCQSFCMMCNQKQIQDMGHPGMVMNDMMIHLVYSSLFFCGRPRSVVSVASNVFFESGADDQVGMTLTHADGTISNLWTSWATHDVAREPWMCTMKVFGSDGTGMASWDNVKNHNLVSPGWDDSVYWDSFYYVQRFFIEECIGEGSNPLSTLDDAIAARAVIDAAILSLESKSFVDITY